MSAHREFRRAMAERGIRRRQPEVTIWLKGAGAVILLLPDHYSPQLRGQIRLVAANQNKGAFVD